MNKIKITQIKSTIGARQNIKCTMEALGLRKINQSVLHTPTPPIQGMLSKVKHLIQHTPQDQ